MLFSYSGFIISRFAEADERNYNGEHIEHLAKYAAHGKIIYVIHYPKRGDTAELRPAYNLAVARPHCKRTARLRYKEENGYPPDLAENEERNERGRCKANFHKDKIAYLFASVAKGEDDAAHYAEHIEKHSCPRAEQGKLERERDTAPHLKEEIVAVFLALIRYERAEHTYVPDKLYGRKSFSQKFYHKYEPSLMIFIPYGIDLSGRTQFAPTHIIELLRNIHIIFAEIKAFARRGELCSPTFRKMRKIRPCVWLFYTDEKHQ